MDRDDQVRKEPTLADLEAFEKLLRESLKTGQPHGDQVHGGSGRTDADAVHAASTDQAAGNQATGFVASGPGNRQDSDLAAMAELARLIDLPVDFEIPGVHPSNAAHPSRPAHATPAESEAAPAPDLHAERHLQGSTSATLSAGWTSTNAVDATFAAAAPAQPEFRAEPLDPLAAFEEELRRFDAIRLAEQNPVSDLRAEYHPEASYSGEVGAGAGDPYQTGVHVEPPQAPPEDQWYAQAPQPPASEAQAASSLDAAEERLAVEAAAGAAAAGYAVGSRRSKGIFLTLGGIAMAGLAVIGGNFVFGSGSKATVPGSVPVIAAKSEPTKQKPENPGGIEIPNQNKQVLAARNTPETKPAQVVNNTEQPLDLNQVTRRDSVRVVAPSPFQAPPSGGSSGVPAPAPAPQADSSASSVAPPQPGSGASPLRVTSVRIPVSGGDTAPSGTAAPQATSSAPSIATAPAARVGTPAPGTPTPLPRIATNAPTPAIKIESRPVTAQARPETPRAEPPPRVAPAPAEQPPKAAPARSSNAPLSLTPPKVTAARTSAPAPAASAGSGYAIQLASRPTEADARSASVQLKGRYASTLGSRAPIVVSGEANGRTVYRVRVTGYSQAQAVDACKKIKVAGGGCFVTKQ